MDSFWELLLLPCGTQAARLGRKCLYALSHLTKPALVLYSVPQVQNVNNNNLTPNKDVRRNKCLYSSNALHVDLAEQLVNTSLMCQSSCRVG